MGMCWVLSSSVIGRLVMYCSRLSFQKSGANDVSWCEFEGARFANIGSFYSSVRLFDLAVVINYVCGA